MKKPKEIKKMTIETVDEGVLNYFNKIDYTMPVPILFFPKERWSYSKFDKALRNEQGTIVLPIISIVKSDITREPDEAFWGLDTTEFVTKKKVIKYIDNVPLYKITTIPHPKFLTINFGIIIWTSTHEHMNLIIEKIINSFKFKQQAIIYLEQGGYLTGHTDTNFSNRSNFDEFSDAKRIFRFTFVLKVPALLLSGDKEQSRLSISKIKFNFEAS